MHGQDEMTLGSGDFLVKKSIFLLTSSVGGAMAETLITRGLEQIGRNGSTLAQGDIVRLAAAIEPALRAFVGTDKARQLTAALRVLVGGV